MASFSSLPGTSSTTNKALDRLANSLSKLSSGSRINKASDDAAGLAIADALESAIVQVGQATRNVNDTSSALSIADGAVDQVQNLNGRLQELATQASNGTYTDEQRATLQAEYSAITQEIQRISETTPFNGAQLLDGSSITAQIGTSGGSSSQLSVGGIDLAGMASSVASQDISTQAGAQAALSAVQSFSDNLSNQRSSTIGAAQSRLDSVDSSLSARGAAEAEALARIKDVDYAEEVASATAASIQSQVGVALSAQAKNINADIVKALLS